MTVLEESMFLFRFDLRIDLNKVLRDGPWRFHQFLLVMKEVFDDTPLVRDILTTIPFWVQIHDVSILPQTANVARSVGGLLGTVLLVDFGLGRNHYPYLRARLEMDIRGSLPKGTTLILNSADKSVKFKYKWLFSFCFWCGLLDHVIDDCVEFLEEGQSFEDCDFDESLHGIPPRPSYSPA